MEKIIEKKTEIDRADLSPSRNKFLKQEFF